MNTYVRSSVYELSKKKPKLYKLMNKTVRFFTLSDWSLFCPSLLSAFIILLFSGEETEGEWICGERGDRVSWWSRGKGNCG